MNRCRYSRAVSWCFALFVIALMLAFPASAEWKEKVLYSFQGGTDGATPTGAVVFDKAGNLYGATGGGGALTCDGPGQCGTLYKLAPPAGTVFELKLSTKKGGAGTEKLIHMFKEGNDGGEPDGQLDL
jgi:hypothetical protein